MNGWDEWMNVRWMRKVVYVHYVYMQVEKHTWIYVQTLVLGRLILLLIFLLHCTMSVRDEWLTSRNSS